MSKLYLAGPLFTVAERQFNKNIALEIEKAFPSMQIMLPQEQSQEFLGQPDFPQRVFQMALQSIEQADLILAVLDGADSDSGTCIELGYARAKNKPIIGVRTDFRASEDQGMNLMVSNICDHLILQPDTNGSFPSLIEEITGRIRGIVGGGCKCSQG